MLPLHNEIVNRAEAALNKAVGEVYLSCRDRGIEVDSKELMLRALCQSLSRLAIHSHYYYGASG